MKYRAPVDPQKSDRENDGLLGQVKKIMQVRYSAFLKGGTIFQGKIQVDDEYEPTNYIFHYNEQGRRILKRELKVSSYAEETFTDEGKPLGTVNFYNGKLYQTCKYVYDDKGNQVEYSGTDAQGNPAFRTYCTYSDNFKIMEHTYYYQNETSPRNRYIYTYDDQGRLIGNEQYKGNAELTSRHIYKYDERGNNIEVIAEHFEEASKKHNRILRNKYNEHNHTIETSYFNLDGSLISTSVNHREYDADGNLILRAYQEEEEETDETSKLETDAQGNWIKKTLYYRDVPVNIIIREIIYWGEADRELTHPLSEQKAVEVIEKKSYYKQLEAEDAKWLTDVQNATPDNFSLVRYYAVRFHEHPSIKQYNSHDIEAYQLLETLKEDHSANEVHSYVTVSSSGHEHLSRYTLEFPAYEGYLLHAAGIGERDAAFYEEPKHFNDDEGSYYASYFLFLRPSEASGRRNQYFEEEIGELMYKHQLKKKPEKPRIHIVEVAGGNFTMKEHAVNDNFEIKDLDVNYGYGFSKFHADLMQRFNSSTKGLVLFHGQPGTGKTYYIRHLLRKMVSHRKAVIYMPPNMVDHLVEPGFMTFLIREVQEFSDDGNFCVLLIEDAEPLLAKRVEGVRIQGVTNLLNMTDGLLNDMLNLQIICTFNVDLRKLDSALLRPGRLIARKEFKPLSELDANLLAQRLGIKHTFNEPATLGEIYSMRKNQSTLVHDVSPDKDSSTLIDDILN